MRALLLLSTLLSVGACSSAPSSPTPEQGEAGASAVVPETPGLLPPLQPEVPPREPPTFDGAVCGAASEPDPEVLRECLLLSACGFGWGAWGGSSLDVTTLIWTLSQCLEIAGPRSDLVTDCEREATTCEELAQCWKTGLYEGSCRPELSHAFFCDGTKMVNCLEAQPPVFFDCARVGATCAEFEWNGRTGVDCIVDSPCEGADDIEFRCDGSKRVKCTGGQPRGEDCAAKRADCVEGSDGGTCAPRGSCVAGTTRCNADDSITLCGYADELEHQLHCAPGLHCVERPDLNLSGVECRVPDCSLEERLNCIEYCTDTTAHLCVGGARLSVDCRDHGFNRCEVFTDEDISAALCQTDADYVFASPSE